MGKEEFGEASSSKTERELTECEFHHHLHHHHPHPHHPLSVPHGPWERRWRQEGGRGKKGQRRSGRGGIRRSDQGRKGASKGDRGWQQKAEAEEDRGRRGKGRESWVKLGSNYFWTPDPVQIWKDWIGSNKSMTQFLLRSTKISKMTHLNNQEKRSED